MTAWTFWQGSWHEGNPMVMGPMTHGSWLASTVFDGARAFEGTMPDVDLHCERMVRSVGAMGLKQLHSADELLEIAKEGVAKFGSDDALYIRPMFWAEDGFVAPDPDSTQFCLCVHDAPLPDPTGFSLTLSPFRRPSAELAITEAKAACHYPNSGRALREAIERGFDNALMLDPLGHVAELATANIFYAKDGIVHTPVPNGTFLNGITRQRIIALLKGAGYEVYERALHVRDFADADEVFSTGNWGKVMPVTRLEAQDLQPGPIYTRARELYWDYAHSR
ncbi:MAG: branched-chain amino acid aminotransferase [Hyphomicrobiales bacterium]